MQDQTAAETILSDYKDYTLTVCCGRALDIYASNTCTNLRSSVNSRSQRPIKWLSYPERLNRLNLYTLEERRVRADLTEVRWFMVCLQYHSKTCLNLITVVAPEVIFLNCWRNVATWTSDCTFSLKGLLMYGTVLMISQWQLHHWILSRAITRDLVDSRWVCLWTALFADPGGHPVYWFGLVR